MRKLCLFLLLSVLGLPLTAQHASRTAFNKGWKFLKTSEDASAYSYDDSAWRSLDLPHDWGVEGDFEQVYPGETGKLPWWGEAWYRKHLNLTAEDLEGLVLLDIDGAMSNSTVWVNGQAVGGRPYGYASYETDLTPALHVGDNVIAIHLDNPENCSRWYPGGGIYRNVWLIKTDRLGIAYNGVAVETELREDGSALVRVSAELRCEGEVPAEAYLFLHMLPETAPDAAPVNAYRKFTHVRNGDILRDSLVIRQPRLWRPEDTQLYTLAVGIGKDASLFEKRNFVEVSVGIRTAEFRADGFYLNGEKTFLKGVCLHHDAGALGAVWSDAAWVRRLNMLKDMGCNAIRTSHNPPAPDLLRLCDRMGFLVMDELTDTWTVPKKPNGYATLFDEWAERDLVDLIHRDRNHPSVILWSIGNECGEQGYPDKWDIPRRLSEICHREDPTRLTTAGNDNLWAASEDYRHTMDVYGFNYKPFAYEAFRDANPGKPFLGSETASCISTRGYYLFPVSDDKSQGWPEGAPFQVSSYDLYAPGWASSPDFEWFYEDQVPECAGEFVWTGFDYLGEPTPYNVDWSILTNFHDPASKAEAEARLRAQAELPPPSRSSYFGIIDLAGFPKDRYYLYQARWRPDWPMAHILPHWNWAGREGEIVPVHVYTSGDSAELFVNGKSQGLKTKGPGEYRLRWDDVIYEAGKVEVVAYKDGSIWATDEVETCGQPSQLSVIMENGHGPRSGYGGVTDQAHRIQSNYIDPEDVFFFNIAVRDKDGRIVPTADNLLSVKISGPAELVFTDAGDPTSHQAFRSSEFRAFAGLGSFGIRLTGYGKVSIKIRSKGLFGINYIVTFNEKGYSTQLKVPAFGIG